MQRKSFLSAQKFLLCIASRRRNREQTEYSFMLRVADIVKGSNEVSLSSGYHLWLYRDFSFTSINTLIEIMNLSLHRYKQNPPWIGKNFLRGNARATGICHVRRKANMTHSRSLRTILITGGLRNISDPQVANSFLFEFCRSKEELNSIIFDLKDNFGFLQVYYTILSFRANRAADTF